jgi:flagellar FliL protein
MTNPATIETSASGAGKTTTITRLTVLALILAVVGAECLLAFMYVPSLAASSQLQVATEPTAPDQDLAQPVNNRREVDLGQYSITAFQPSSNTTLLIDFRLFGTVACKPGEEAPAAEAEEAAASDDFSKLFEKHKHRIRDQVITIVRSAEMTDFADPSLGLIRRKILEKSNRTLGKPFLEEVIFSEFSLIEQ